jgi:hypothetical protein
MGATLFLGHTEDGQWIGQCKRCPRNERRAGVPTRCIDPDRRVVVAWWQAHRLTECHALHIGPKRLDEEGEVLSRVFPEVDFRRRMGVTDPGGEP